MANGGLNLDSKIGQQTQLPSDSLAGTQVPLSADWMSGDFASFGGQNTSDVSDQTTQSILPTLTLEQSQSALPSTAPAAASAETTTSAPASAEAASQTPASVDATAPAPASAEAAPVANSGPTSTTTPEASAPASATSLGSVYADYNSAVGPSAGVDLTYKNATLSVASGADADAGLHLNKSTSIMEASVKDGNWTVGAMPTTMGVENTGPDNPFNTYSDIFENLRTTALGVKYSPDDKFSVGITNDSTKGNGLVPNALEATYTTPLNQHTTLNAGVDLSAKQATVDANVDYTKGKLTASADFLQKNGKSIGSVEGTYQIDKDLSVSARFQSTGKQAVAVREKLPDGFFVQAQEENGQPSVEAGIKINL